MRGRCIQAPEKSNLVEGEIYYLFQHGGLAYNVSIFPHPGAHFGTYQKSRFELVEAAVDVPTQTTSKYLARVVKPPSHFYMVGEEYVITEPKVNGYYSVFLKSRPNHGPIGSYRSNYFEIIEPYEVIEAAVVNDMLKVVQKKVKTVNDLPEMANVPVGKTKYEQLSLF